MAQSTEHFNIVFLDNEAPAEEYSKLQTQQVLPFAISGVFHSLVKYAIYQSQGEHVKTVIEMCLNIEGSGMQYQPGDTIGVLPENSIEEVQEIIHRLGYDDFAQKVYSLSVKPNCKKKIPSHVPVIGTIQKVLINNLDIRSPPKKMFLKALSKYMTDEQEINRINDMCLPSGSLLYNNFITDECLALVDLFRIFPSCNAPFCLLVEYLPRLQPRPYSIANSPIFSESSKNEIHFVFTLVKLPNREGVCTGWLNKVINTSSDSDNQQKILIFKKNTKIVSYMQNTLEIKIPIYLRKLNDFRLPEDPERNLILIGAGSGVAPFIGFMQHRLAQHNQQVKCGKIWLFFGNRYQSHDYLFRSEIEAFLNIGVLTRLSTAFSRESCSQKYVQDCIIAEAKDFIEMITDEDATIFVCGSKNMCMGVSDTVAQAFLEMYECTAPEAEEFVQELRKDSRYVEDMWT